MKIKNLNPELKEMNADYLYHLGLDTTMDLSAIFNDVKFVCMGGSSSRALNFAQKIAKELNLNISKQEIKPIGKTERYSLFKIGPVISVSHGIGMPSITNLLNEITKLLYYAKALDPVYIRVGTSGGIGVEPGTVVISEECISSKLEPYYEQTVLRKTTKYPTKLNQKLNKELFNSKNDLYAVIAKTMGTNSFYEEQARLDGALNPGFSKLDKKAFLQHLYDLGVRNIEMESPGFAAFCLLAGINASVVCATLIDRLKGDNILATKQQLAKYSDNAEQLVINYIKNSLETSRV